MPKGVCVILNWNVDYAEIPRHELPTVVAQSYERMVVALQDWPQGTVCFNMTGPTLDYLDQNAPALLRRVKRLVSERRVEMLASSHSHAILPLLPRTRIRSQIRTHTMRIKQIFDTEPQGFWPPELAVSPVVLLEIAAAGLKWTAADYEHYSISQVLGNTGNPFERRSNTTAEMLSDAYTAKGVIGKPAAYLKALGKTLRMLTEQKTVLSRLCVDKGASVPALLCSTAWSIATHFALGRELPEAIYSARKHTQNIDRCPADYVPLFASDMEYWGYRGLKGPPPDPEELVAFLSKLNGRGIRTLTPSQIPPEAWPPQSVFVGTGSWSPDASLRIWQESADNRELARRSEEIYRLLGRLHWDPEIMHEIEHVLQRTLERAENSDARGWIPSIERKQESYAALLKVVEMLSEQAEKGRQED